MRCPLAKDPDTILDWIASIEIRASERAYPGTLVAGSRCMAKSTRNGPLLWTKTAYTARPEISVAKSKKAWAGSGCACRGNLASHREQR